MISNVTNSILQEMRSELYEKLDDKESKLNQGVENATSLFKAICLFISKALHWAYIACTIGLLLCVGSALVDVQKASEEMSVITDTQFEQPINSESKPQLDPMAQVNSHSLPAMFVKPQTSRKTTEPLDFSEFFYIYCGFTFVMLFYYFILALMKLVYLSPVGSRARHKNEIDTRLEFVGEVSEIVEEVLVRHDVIQGGKRVNKSQ